MVITPEDLADWNSNPVTKEVFKEVDKAVLDLSNESPLRDTADQTAMQAAYNDGVIAGANYFSDAYQTIKEDNE